MNFSQNNFLKSHFLRKKKAPAGTPILAQGLYPAGQILRKSAFQKMAEQKSNLEKKVHNSTSTNGNKIEIGFVHTISSRRSYLEGSTPLRRRQTGLFWENRVFAWNKNASWGPKSMIFLESS